MCAVEHFPARILQSVQGVKKYNIVPKCVQVFVVILHGKSLLLKQLWRLNIKKQVVAIDDRVF